MGNDLEKAVAAWIRAEWAFRAGPNAYRGDTQLWFETACDVLRAVATGHSDLEKAAQKVGLPGQTKKPEITRLKLNRPFSA